MSTMSRRLRASARNLKAAQPSPVTEKKRENEEFALPTPTPKKRKRNKKEERETVYKAEADSTMTTDPEVNLPAETAPLAPVAAVSTISHLSPPKPTLLDLADAAASMEQEIQLQSSNPNLLTQPPSRNEPPQTTTLVMTPQTAIITYSEVEDTVTSKSPIEETESVETRAKNEEDSKIQMPSLNKIMASAETSSSQVGDLVAMEPRNLEEVQEEQAGESKVFGVLQSSCTGQQICDPSSSAEIPVRDSTERLITRLDDSETVITDADGNILISYNHNVPMDDLLKTLATSAGLNLEEVDNDSHQPIINDQQHHMHHDSMNQGYSEHREYHQLKTADMNQRNGVEKDVFMGEGPEEDYVQLAVLDEISMDQLVGGDPEDENQRYSAFQPYGQGQNLCYARQPKISSTKTKAAADRLRNLLQLPPEPMQLTRMRQLKRANQKQHFQVPMLNPALSGGPIGPHYLEAQLRATQILHSVPSQRYNLRAVTLAPVQLPTHQANSTQQQQEVKATVAEVPTLTDSKKKSEFIVIEKQQRTGDGKRHRYASDIAKLQKPTPLESVLAQTRNQIETNSPKKKGKFRKQSESKPEMVELVSQRTADMVDSKNSIQGTPVEDPESSQTHLKNWMTKTGRVKRPMNAFMVWARRARPEVASMLDGPTNADVSVKLGDLWREMTDEEKEPYYQEAHVIRMKHSQLFPDWMYKPSSDNNKTPIQKRQASPYWRNFVRFGNVEGFRIHTVPASENSVMIDPETPQTNMSLISGEGSTNGSLDTTDAEVAATLHCTTLDGDVTSHVLDDDTTNIIRQAFNLSQQPTHQAVVMDEDGKETVHTIYVQLNETELDGRAESEVRGQSTDTEGRAMERMTPLQKVQMSNDFKVEVPFITSNLVPMIEPTSPDKIGQSARKKDKLSFTRRRRPAPSPVPGRHGKSSSWLLPFDPYQDRQCAQETAMDTRNQAEVPVYHTNTPVKTVSGQQYYPAISEPRDSTGATSIWDGFGTIESLSDTACSRYLTQTQHNSYRPSLYSQGQGQGQGQQQNEYQEASCSYTPYSAATSNAYHYTDQYLQQSTSFTTLQASHSHSNLTTTQRAADTYGPREQEYLNAAPAVHGAAGGTVVDFSQSQPRIGVAADSLSQSAQRGVAFYPASSNQQGARADQVIINL